MKKKKKQKKKKTKKKLLVPSPNELEKYYQEARKRITKVDDVNKIPNIRKQYISESRRIINEQLETKNDPYLFLKTLTIELLDQMSLFHELVYKNDVRLIDYNEFERYIIFIHDKNSLDIASKIVKDVKWGNEDWHEN